MKKGKSFVSRSLPPRTVLAVFVCLGLTLSHFFAFKLGEIAGTPSTPAKRSAKTPPIRVPLFIDPGRVSHQSRFSFTYDSPAALQELRSFLSIDTIMAPGRDPWEKVALWMNWVRSQWEPGRPDPYPPIEARAILERIRSGGTGGFCAQYNYVFVQGLQSLGIPARYVTVRDHEVTEVWMAGERIWACWDPLYRCRYMDSEGKPLSALGVRRELEAGRTVTMPGSEGISDSARHLERFREIAIWLKNDHVGSPINFSDIERYKVHFTDKEIELEHLPVGALFTPFAEDLYGFPQ